MVRKRRCLAAQTLSLTLTSDSIHHNEDKGNGHTDFLNVCESRDSKTQTPPPGGEMIDLISPSHRLNSTTGSSGLQDVQNCKNNECIKSEGSETINRRSKSPELSPINEELMCGKMPPRSIENKLGYKRDSSTHPDQIKKRDKVLARKTRNIRENYNKDGYSIQRAINRAKQSDIIKRNQQKMDNKSYYEKTNCNIKAKRGFCENDACRFNHDFEVKKMESVCKYYTTDSCNKGDACIFMHGEYPCKYFHIRNFCFNADSCKFSHKPLTETGKRLIEDIKAKINENKQLKQNQTGIEVSFGTRIPHAEPINLNPTDKFRDIMNQSMVQSGINGLPLQNLNHSSHELISNLQGMEHASYLGIDLSSSCNPYTNNAMPHTEEITNLKQPEDVSNNNENITNEMSESFSLIKFTGKKICSLPQGHIDNKDPRVERYKVCKV